MKRQLKIAFLLAGIFYVLFGVFITLYQEKIIYQPSSRDFASCIDFKDAEKVEYNGTRMYVSEGKRGVVILYHGNAGSACDRYFYAELFKNEGYGYIIPEYVGYGDDVHKPSHEYIKKDVINVVSYVAKKEYKNIIVVGESIGTGMASFHVSLSSPNKVLLISPFTSILDIAKSRFWFYPVVLMVDNQFDNTSLLNKYYGQIEIIHGNRDNVIPQNIGRKLYSSLVSKNKEFVSVEGFGHNDLFMTDSTYTAIRKFLN